MTDAEARKKFDEQMRKKHGCDQIKAALKKYPQFAKLDKNKRNHIINELERGCNNSTIKTATKDKVKPRWWTNEYYCNIYSSKIYQLTFNIDPDLVDSDYLFNLIINDKVKLSDVADMHSNEMCPEKSADIIKEMNDRLHEKIQAKTTTRYKCPKCKKRETQVQEKQLRSFDEGTNMSLTCMHCNYHWVL